MGHIRSITRPQNGSLLRYRNHQWAKAQCQTIRLKLLKIGGQIRVSVRRVSLSLSEGYPYQPLYAQALTQLQQLG